LGASTGNQPRGEDGIQREKGEQKNMRAHDSQWGERGDLPLKERGG